jgi:hypothetical protein
LSCTWSPRTTDGAGGVTEIETRVAALTIRVTDGEVTPPTAALIEVAPTPVAFAKPLEPLALLRVATVEAVELQVADLVRSWVDRSLYRPVAANCCCVPLAIVVIDGVTAIETRVAAVTFRAMPTEVTPSNCAVMRVVPTPDAVTIPVLLTPATVGVADSHVTESVMS